MRTNYRKPRRFPFKTKMKAILVGELDKTYQKEVEMVCLGQFGYHNFYPEIWNVTHIGSGYCVKSCKSEVEAKRLCKQLYLRCNYKWKPGLEKVIQALILKYEMERFSDAVKKAIEKPTFDTLPIGHGMFQYGGTDDDIPF